ncbi:MAG: isocitrate dehydrogenase kinase/phosphatase AceK regulatory subunit, partial [Pseudomonadota bacterium]
MIRQPKRDFGTLRTEAIAQAGFARLATAGPDADKAALLAEIIVESFDDYYGRSRKIPGLAKEAFEARDWPAAIALSQERIAIYSVAISKIGPPLKHYLDEHRETDDLWAQVETAFSQVVAERYERDLAKAYLTSVRRFLHQTTWEPDPEAVKSPTQVLPSFVRLMRVPGRITPDLIEAILMIPDLNAAFRDLTADAEAVAGRINSELVIGVGRTVEHVEVIEAGFFRNRGAYIVGAIQVAGERRPLALALLNRADGIEVDAVILRQTTLAHVFSSTLANFHVTLTEYHELVDYLHGLMPLRPHSEHYSTIGYNHVGKIAIMNQI